VQTVGDLAVFSVRQESSIAICDARRAALVAIIQAHAAIVKPPSPRWMFWR
jgi:hypothetical protein